MRRGLALFALAPFVALAGCGPAGNLSPAAMPGSGPADTSSGVQQAPGTQASAQSAGSGAAATHSVGEAGAAPQGPAGVLGPAGTPAVPLGSGSAAALTPNAIEDAMRTASASRTSASWNVNIGYAREAPFSAIHGHLHFEDDGTTLKVVGHADHLNPNLTYISFVYGNGSVARGSQACLPPTPNNLTFNQMVLGYWLPVGSSRRTLVATKTGMNNAPTDYASLTQFATASIRWDTTPTQPLSVNQSPARYYLQTCSGVHQRSDSDDGGSDATIDSGLSAGAAVPAAPTQTALGDDGRAFERPFSPIRARMLFTDDGQKLTVYGDATGMNPGLSYISFIYGTGSVGRGSTACLPPTPNNLTFNQMVLGYWLPVGASHRTLYAVKQGSNSAPTDYAALSQFATTSIRWDTTPTQSLAVNQSPARYYLQTCSRVRNYDFSSQLDDAD